MAEPTEAVLADLARVKAVFQLRAVAAHMGFPAGMIAPVYGGATDGRPMTDELRVMVERDDG